MKELRISVKDKIATLVEDVELVCGNSDYRVVFEFDNDWEEYNAKTALFVFGDTTVEVPFFGNVIEPEDAVAIERATKCFIGVYTGDLVTTTKAEVKCLPSIRDIAKTASKPKEDVYLRLLKLINDIKLGGSAIIEVDELPQFEDEINSNILYRTSEGLFYYNGFWEKLIDERDTESIMHDLAVVESLAKGAHQAVSFGNYETMVTALNALPKDTYKISQSIMIVTLNVPDLWVSAIAEESVPYTYVDDTALANEIFTNGSVQVGYYVLSALETQKVDLTDYALKTDVPKVGQNGFTLSKGYLYNPYALENDFKNKKENHFLRPAHYPLIGKYGLAYNDLTLTDEEKASARTWLGAVGVTDYASDSKAGVIRLNSQWGYVTTANGQLHIFDSDEADMPNRHIPSHGFRNRPIKYGQLDLAVKTALTSNEYTLTDEEKSSAAKWLGVPNAYEVDRPDLVVDIPRQVINGFTIYINPDTSAELVSTQTFTKEELMSGDIPFYIEAEDTTNHTTKTYKLSEFSTASERTGYTQIDTPVPNADGNICSVSVFVVTDYTIANIGDAKPSSNGIYFARCSYHNMEAKRLYREGKGIKRIDNKFLDLEGNDTIKALVARIEALENN